jgi:DNA polymerase-3 subunit chi
LLEKTLAKGWRALVRSGDPNRLEALDQTLWTWRDDSFLPHGRSDQPDADRQPVLLATDEANPNAAQCLFLLDGAQPENPESFERVIVMFDGQDESAVNGARRLWKQLTTPERSLSYWRQSPEGRWEKKQ